jgi:hypothetical protein
VAEVRRTPCEACPYRQDVPSGVWSEAEYEKLRPYDGETWEQPPGAFACHAAPARLCHGWAVVSARAEHSRESLALRIEGCPDIPEAAAPLFATHGEAADHGLRAVEAPPDEAVQLAERLRRKHTRLR